MDQLSLMQRFVIAWMDELWWSMRDRVGALSIIECLQNSWRAAGREVGEFLQQEGLSPTAAAKMMFEVLGRKVSTKNGELLVSSCPFWNRIKERGLEYALRCEEFTCAPLLEGLKEAMKAEEARVDISIRQVHVERAKLEYKLSKLAVSTNPQAGAQRAKLEQQLANLPKQPVCRMLIK